MMADDNNPMQEAVYGLDDARDLSFDLMGAEGATALVCESDPELREKLNLALAEMGYRTAMPVTAAEVVRAIRFHLFDVVVVNERFDAADAQTNGVLQHLRSMVNPLRRRLFVVLVSDACRTMDHMAAFDRSVNLVIHRGDVDRAGGIIGQAVADNRAFYHVFQETLRKMGKG
ncbi:MAG: hypothetical protein AB1558_09060 [Thermodesulfobacteriota bacterium]